MTVSGLLLAPSFVDVVGGKAERRKGRGRSDGRLGNTKRREEYARSWRARDVKDGGRLRYRCVESGSTRPQRVGSTMLKERKQAGGLREGKENLVVSLGSRWVVVGKRRSQGKRK